MFVLTTVLAVASAILGPAYHKYQRERTLAEFFHRWIGQPPLKPISPELAKRLGLDPFDGDK